MGEGLSQVARDVPRTANQHTVNRQYSLSFLDIFGKIKAMVPSIRDSNRRLLQSEVCLDNGFDNFQIFI